MRRSSTFLSLVWMAAFSCPCFAAKVVLTVDVVSFPYTASSNDTIVVDDSPETVTVFSQAGRIIRIVGGVTGVRVLLDNDTLVFDTDSSSSGSSNECGILIDTVGGSRPSDIVIKGGGIRSPIQIGHGLNSPGASSPSRRHCIWLIDGHDVTIDSVNLSVDGHNSSCVEWGAVGEGISTGYNILHRGGVYHNYSESYSDRQNYQSAVCNTDNFTSQSGNYTVRMEGVTVIAEGHIGIQTKTGAFQIVDCDITVDARNRYWDSLACFVSGSCDIGHSSANAYGILMRFPGNGSLIQNCTVTSGNTKYGSRGIMLESTTNNSRSSDSIIIERNYVDAHEGPTGEDNDGTVRVFRYRNRESGSDQFSYVKIRNNTFIGTADNESGTTAIGTSAFVWDYTHGADDSANIMFENNTIKARSLSTSGATAWCTFFGAGALTNHSLTIRNNRWEGCQTLIRFNDEDNGIGGNNFALVGDTFIPIDTTIDTLVKISNFRTFYLGYDNDNTLNNSITDGVWLNPGGYVNQAKDTNIVFGGISSAAEFAVKRTLDLLVQDGTGDPVAGASVKVINSYGDTVYSGVTSAEGKVDPIVTYWYEENNHTSVDSTGYNPFTFIAEYEEDADTTSLTVTSNIFTDTLTLSSTLVGEPEFRTKRIGKGKLGKVKL